MTAEENKRMLALSYIVADLKAENMELTLRAQQLEDDNNRFACLLRETENRKDKDPSKQTQDEMKHLRDHCDMLEKNIEQLKRECNQLQIERNEAKTHAEECELQKEELFKHIARFNNSELLEIGDDCTYQNSLPFGSPVKVGSEKCCSCPHLIKVDESGKKCVLCAYCYDDKKAKEAQERKPTDD